MSATVPLFSLTCPSCGATVPVHSASSMLVVCEYCHSTLLRSGDAVLDSGRKSAILEDYSPLQLQAGGVHDRVPFTLVGRRQIQYEGGGGWSEWYALFADGTDGWLADFCGEYTFTRQVEALKNVPDFKRIRPGQTSVSFAGKTFVASDVRHATSKQAHAQGELPGAMQGDEVLRVADFRFRDEFLTLDYSENARTPLFYHGKSVQLDNLRCQNLRTIDRIRETTGRLRGQRSAFACPNCGASLAWYAGITCSVICPSCQSVVVLTEEKARVLDRHAKQRAVLDTLPLKLGDVASIQGQRWDLIGMARIQETTADSALNCVSGVAGRVSREGACWNEYLLYNPLKGFCWLVHSEGEWSLSHTLGTWPVLTETLEPAESGNRKRALPKLYNYGGEVEFAAGAFYWPIQPGDVTYYQDYQQGGTLCGETSRSDHNWSRSRTVTGEEMARWFKRPELAQLLAPAREKAGNERVKGNLGRIVFAVFCLINLPVLRTAVDNDTLYINLIITMVTYYLLVGFQDEGSGLWGESD